MRSLLIPLACVLLVLASCGGESGSGNSETTISAQEYAAAADALCAQVARDVSGLGAVEKLEEIQAGSGSETEKMMEAADLFEQQLQLITSFREDLEALGTPATGAEDVDALLEQARSAEDELRRAVDALRDGDEEEAAEALQAYFGFAQESASAAQDSELDFAVCGGG